MTRRRRRRERPTERDIASLADGTLAPERREHVESAVAASADLQAALRDQRLAIGAIRATAEEPAPAGLRLRVAQSPSGRRAPRVAGALALAATAAAIALTLGGGGSRRPTVVDVTMLATRPPVAAAPSAKLAGWDAVGTRSDRLGGRSATTVFYRRRGEVVAFTVVDGGPLPLGSTARTSMRGGTTLRSLVVHGRHTVTWLRRGQTCVLSGTGTGTAALFRLATA